MRIAVIGGGATGALAAAHLIRRFGAGRVEVSVIDPAPSIGRGLAYSTRDPRHLLNVRVANMSAFANEPEHLLNWLRRRSGEDTPTPFCFISRNTYGDYVSDVARQALDSGAVRHIRDLAVDLVEEPTQIALRLALGAHAQCRSRGARHRARPQTGDRRHCSRAAVDARLARWARRRRAAHDRRRRAHHGGHGVVARSPRPPRAHRRRLAPRPPFARPSPCDAPPSRGGEYSVRRRRVEAVAVDSRPRRRTAPIGAPRSMR